MLDDFGDPTGETQREIQVMGTFSNTATSGSKCLYHLVDYGGSLMISIYEYGNSPATSTESTSETIKLKKADGEVVTINYVDFSENGYLYFSSHDRKYQEFFYHIEEKGTYKFQFNKGRSSYRFDLSIN